MTDDVKCTLLIVDDDPDIAHQLKHVLEHDEIQALLAHNINEALAVIGDNKVDVVLTDIGTEEWSGFDLLSQITDTDESIKVIMMTEGDCYEVVKRALKENAYDFLNKPFVEVDSVIASVQRAFESSRLIRENNKLIEQLHTSHYKVTAANKRLLQLNKQLRKLAITDGLTQLYNRRYIDDWIQNYAYCKTNPDANYSVILLDIDYFKSINDSLGHDGGDKVLKHLAKILNDSSRDEDLVGRYGGEEFIVVMPGTDEAESINAAERIRSLIEHAIITVSSGTAKTTASFGVSTNLTAVSTPVALPMTTAEAFFSGRALIAQADKALYAAKDNGRNQTIHYNQLPTSESVESFPSSGLSPF
jgi:diguanylate cyclase (GGDEF)-like protein